MKKLLTIFILVLLSNFVAAQVSKTVNVTTAGTLSTLLTSNEKATLTDLTVTGNIDARDFNCLYNMRLLANIDISNTTVKSWNGTNNSLNLLNIVFPENELPAWAFFTGCSNSTLNSKETLKSIILPKTLIAIGEFSLYCNYNIPCTNFTKIVILSTNPPIIKNNAFAPCTYNNASLYVPKLTLNIYKEAVGWKLFTNIVEIGLTVSTNSISQIKLSSALLNGKIELMDTPVSSHGFCWNTTGSPTLSGSKIDKGATTTIGTYDYTITNLQPSTTYYVRAFATDGTGTVYGSETSFTTASLPLVAGTISGLQTVCQGQTSVTYTVPTIANATSYIWTLPAGIVGTSSTNSITLKYERYFTTGSITVKGHNEWGDGIASKLDVTASLLPGIAGAISGNKIVCQGENSVTYTVQAIDNATSYKWVLPTGATGSSPTNSITVNFSKSAVSGNITVKGHNDCGDGIVSYSMVTVNQLPTIELRDTAVISGGTVPLFPIITYTGTGELKYKWTPSTGLNNDTIAQPLATVASQSAYTLVVTTVNGCTASAIATVNMRTMAKPEIGIVGVTSTNKNRIVWNKPVSTGIASYYIYKETNTSNVFEKIGTVPYDSLSVFVDNQSSPDVKSNKYKLSIFDRNGMESPLSDAHKTMHLSINKGQNTTWNLIWEAYEGFNVSTYNIYRGTNANNLNFLDATSGSSTQYSDLSAPAGDVYYQLEVISSILINPTKAPTSIQKSKGSENSTGASLVSYNSSRSNIATHTVSGVNELNGENKQINIYPNPVKDQLRIDFEGGSTFEILNLMGQVVYNGDLIKNTIVQTSNLSSGVYLIKFKIGKTFEYKRLIKE